MFAYASYAKRALRVVLAAAILLPAEVVLLAPQKADAYVASALGSSGLGAVTLFDRPPRRVFKKTANFGVFFAQEGRALPA